MSLEAENKTLFDSTKNVEQNYRYLFRCFRIFIAILWIYLFINVQIYSRSIMIVLFCVGFITTCLFFIFISENDYVVYVLNCKADNIINLKLAHSKLQQAMEENECEALEI